VKAVIIYFKSIGIVKVNRRLGYHFSKELKKPIEEAGEKKKGAPF
jgi:hypothetical protein